jgi:hypothetical protein
MQVVACRQGTFALTGKPGKASGGSRIQDVGRYKWRKEAQVSQAFQASPRKGTLIVVAKGKSRHGAKEDVKRK